MSAIGRVAPRGPAWRPWRLLAISLLLALAAACGRSAPPPRPAGVPAEAFWLGGPDGGAFVALGRTAGDAPQVVRARIYYRHGELWYAGRLRAERGTAPVDITRPELFSGWDGEALHLSDGRALRKAP
jgi:hypothetical protein